LLLHFVKGVVDHQPWRRQEENHQNCETKSNSLKQYFWSHFFDLFGHFCWVKLNQSTLSSPPGPPQIWKLLSALHAPTPAQFRFIHTFFQTFLQVSKFYNSTYTCQNFTILPTRVKILQFYLGTRVNILQFYLQVSKFYNFKASLNHRANACSCSTTCLVILLQFVPKSPSTQWKRNVWVRINGLASVGR
jgi:hypothetical protein